MRYAETEKNNTGKKTVAEVAKEVLDGKWGNGNDRKNRLIAAGYNYDTVQKKVNKLVKKLKANVTKIAKEVIAGKWGNGEERRVKLTAAGYDYDTIQDKVDKLMKGS